MKPQRKYRLGTASNNYMWGGGRLNRFYGAPTFTLIFRYGINLNKKTKKKKHSTYIFTYYLFLPQNVTGIKAGSFKGGRIASTHSRKRQRKNRLGTASNNYWGGGFKPVLRGPNLHPHLPPRFTQFSWLFGSHGGLLAHQCVITGNS